MKDITEAVPNFLVKSPPNFVCSSFLRSETPLLAFQKKKKLTPPPIRMATLSRI